MDVTFALGVLLAAGFLAAKIVQLARLPSVTGYILVGVLLGPSGMSLVDHEMLGSIGHFTEIALMLIAFGIGEHLDLRHLRHSARRVGFIALGETSGAFLLVSVGTFLVARAIGVGDAAWGVTDFIVLALLLGAVSVATAPAATLHVMRELKAAGPLTRTLMAVVALDDGLAIIIFGIAMTAAHHVVGGGGESIAMAIGGSLVEIGGALLIGVVAGLLIDFVVHRLKRRGEMLTVGIALVLLCGEVARMLDVSELLAGMAAGFTIVNRDRRDVRVFRLINDFEPPIFALFFTLAGAHLSVSALVAAGWVGVAYSLLRIAGKLLGAGAGARIGNAPKQVVRYLGLALTPQAGVAIGLIFLIQTDDVLGAYSSVVTPVVLAGVVFAELVGPVLARVAVVRAGEVEVRAPDSRAGDVAQGSTALALTPWTWDPLTPSPSPSGSVVFGASNPETATGLARIAALLANHHGARPVAVCVVPPGGDDRGVEGVLSSMEEEITSLGLALEREVVIADDVPEAIIAASRKREAHAILLGHPVEGSSPEFDRVLEAVGRDAACPVIVLRQIGTLHTERILVPVGGHQELAMLQGVIEALSAIGPHRVTLLRMMRSDTLSDQLEEAEREMFEWTHEVGLAGPVVSEAVAAESRLAAICEAAASHDLLVMTAQPTRGLKRLFFGSLAEDVIVRCAKPVMMVRG